MEERKVTSAAISVEGLIKNFKGVQAVKGISFAVEEGELFAFLGENGAGKSTTISVLCGLLQKDGGKAYVCGKDTDKDDSFQSDIGVVFQGSVLDKALSARENLRCRAALYGIVGVEFEKRLAELCELLRFEEFIDRPLARLSGGQKRRIDIARALLPKPKILVLDEPTTGLDPQTRKSVWEVTEKLRKERKTTVFLTTHYMEEAAKADYVVILDKGKVVAEGTPRALKNRYTGDRIVLYGEDKERLLAALGESAVKNAEISAESITIKVQNTAEATRMIATHPELFEDYEVLKGDMDDVFLTVTGKTLKNVGLEEAEERTANKTGARGGNDKK